MPILVVIALFAAAGTVVIALATRTRRVQRLDDALEGLAGDVRLRMHRAASIATLTGEAFVHPFIGAGAAIAVLLARRGPALRVVLPLLAASFGAIAAHHLVKFFYHRPRPAIALSRNKTEAAYPSGHTTNATSVLVTCAYLLVREGLLPAPFAVACVAAIALATGASRVALGWHWGSDVVGGWCTGIAVAALSAELYEVLSRP